MAECGSFRRAAEKLRVSQPTLTAQIASMEKSLGAKLFERNRMGTGPSLLGRELLRHARRVVEEYRGLIDSAASIVGGPAGTFRFGVTPTLGPYLLPHVLPRALQQGLIPRGTAPVVDQREARPCRDYVQELNPAYPLQTTRASSVCRRIECQATMRTGAGRSSSAVVRRPKARD